MHFLKMEILFLGKARMENVWNLFYDRISRLYRGPVELRQQEFFVSGAAIPY